MARPPEAADAPTRLASAALRLGMAAPLRRASGAGVSGRGGARRCTESRRRRV